MLNTILEAVLKEVSGKTSWKWDKAWDAWEKQVEGTGLGPQYGAEAGQNRGPLSQKEAVGEKAKNSSCD